MNYLNRRFSVSTWILWITITLACASQIALIAIMIGLSTTNTVTVRKIRGTALAASVLDIVALVASIIMAFLFIRRTAWKTLFVLGLVFALLAILSALLTIYALAWIWNDSHPVKVQRVGVSTTLSLSEAGFATWTIAIVTQLVLYTFVLWPRDKSRAQSVAEELPERSSPIRSIRRSLSTPFSLSKSPTPPPFTPPPEEPVSSAFSTYSTSPRSSFRYSVSQVIRPVASKTKLLLRTSLVTKDSRSLHSGRETSMDVMIQDDGFQDWDTSAVEDSHDSRTSRRITTQSRLEPIPGSRPVSPAKPLDGPFPEESYLPDSPLQSPIASPGSETSSLRTVTQSRSRRESNAEAHIHPLFRSESPVPPPVASPGTVITASPIAGQVVAAEHHYFGPRRLHSAQSMRADSPSPYSPSRSRASSMRSVGMYQPSLSESRISESRTSMRSPSSLHDR